MIVKNKNREKGCFFQGDNEIVQRPDLSMEAKGLMCYLLSLPETWDLHISKLYKSARNDKYVFTNGRKPVERAMEELIKKGYVKKFQGVNKRKDTKYTVYETPIQKEVSETDASNNDIVSETDVVLRPKWTCINT